MTARFEFDLTTDGEVAQREEGVASVVQGDGRLHERISSPQKPGLEGEGLVVGGDSYQKLPEHGETGLPPEYAGKWARSPGLDESGSPFSSGLGLSGILELLSKGEPVTSAGTETVDGRRAELFDVTTASPWAETDDDPNAEDWLPATVTYRVATVNGLVASLDFAFAANADGLVDSFGPSSTATPRQSETRGHISLLQYGVPLDVHAPPPDQVVDLDDIP